MKTTLLLFLTLWIAIYLVSCKKDPVTQNPDPEYQETRSARITGIELTDKDFRQYFIYGEDGLLDSVKREGGFWYGDPLENIITVSHATDYIRLHTIWDKYEDSYWRNVAFFHQNQKISGAEYMIRYHPFALPPTKYYSEIFYSSDELVKNYKFNIIQNENDTAFYNADIFLENKKLISYTSTSENSNILPNYSFEYAYIKHPLVPRDVIRFINNDLSNFLRVGEDSGIDWKSLVYGLSGYELPIQEKDEIISQIRYKSFSKEDGSLLQDSTVTFDYQVDTLNRKISFGNQILTYEFVE